jgi:hypothetical protein
MVCMGSFDTIFVDGFASDFTRGLGWLLRVGGLDGGFDNGLDGGLDG